VKARFTWAKGEFDGMAVVTDEYWRRIRPDGWTYDISVSPDETDPPFPEERTEKCSASR
jgi:hypothetical protein